VLSASIFPHYLDVLQLPIDFHINELVLAADVQANPLGFLSQIVFGVILL
jgi:hypothetical protein